MNRIQNTIFFTIVVLSLVLTLCVLFLALENIKLRNRQPSQVDDYWLLEVTERRRVDNGWEYQLKEQNDTAIDDTWFYSENLFSIGELILGIEYEDNTFVLIDLS